METTPRGRSFLARFLPLPAALPTDDMAAPGGAVRPLLLAVALLLTALALSPGSTLLLAQDGDIPPAPEESEPTPEESGDAAESDVPPIPDWTPEDAETRELYEQARLDLAEHRYSAAERAFKKLRSKARGTPGEETIARCLREAEGGELCEKAGKHRDREQYRKIIALWLKNQDDVADTFTGAELERMYDEAMAMVFHLLDDFEPEEDSDDEKEGEDGNDGGDDADGPNTPEEAMRRLGLGGGYGANTRVITGSPEAGEVRQGEGALRWQLTANLGVVTLAIPPEVHLDEYRYLRISLRTEDGGNNLPVKAIFDCEEGLMIGMPGGGRGGRGMRGGNAWLVNAVQRRVGFHADLQSTSRWKDLRIDLKKFEERGGAKWANVLNLRLVHLGGTGEGAIVIDDVLLERD